MEVTLTTILKALLFFGAGLIAQGVLSYRQLLSIKQALENLEEDVKIFYDSIIGLRKDAELQFLILKKLADMKENNLTYEEVLAKMTAPKIIENVSEIPQLRDVIKGELVGLGVEMYDFKYEYIKEVDAFIREDYVEIYELFKEENRKFSDFVKFVTKPIM